MSLVVFIKFDSLEINFGTIFNSGDSTSLTDYSITILVTVVVQNLAQPNGTIMFMDSTVTFSYDQEAWSNEAALYFAGNSTSVRIINSFDF